MKTFVTALLTTSLLMTAGPVLAVSATQGNAKAINYRELKGSTVIDLNGTVLTPGAKGSAKIRNKAGITSVKAEFENLAEPSQFGREFLTYVFWAISPDGRATNLGELTVKNGRSELNTTTPLQSMSLIVTAEPYFAASQPSDVVVMENAIRPGTTKKIALVDAAYELLPRGQYTMDKSMPDALKVMDKKTPFMVYQARNAVRVARAAGAEAYATKEFQKSEELLEKAENRTSDKQRILSAREAVQSAEASRLITMNRQKEEKLATERAQAQKQIATAQGDAALSKEERAAAIAAQVKAEQAKALSDSERASALEAAKNAALDSTHNRDEAEKARVESKEAQTAAQIAQGEVTAERASAAAQMEKSAAEKAALRAELLQQLNTILQTRDTARGLIVNMSDVLFKSGSEELRPQVREKLAKISGIVTAHPGLKLELEGYTDSVGSEEFNQKLSEGRARNAMNYLISQGVSADSIVSRGFGESKPIESNDTEQGRQMNRRVEMIVSGGAIGTLMKASLPK